MVLVLIWLINVITIRANMLYMLHL